MSFKTNARAIARPEFPNSPADALGRDGFSNTRRSGQFDLALPRTGSLISRAVIRGVARVTEGLMLITLGLAIAVSYVAEPALLATYQYHLALIATALATVVIYDALGLYSVTSLASITRPIGRLVLGWTVATAMLTVAVFFLKIGPEFSRVWLALWYGGGAVAILSARALFSLQVGKWVRAGRLERRAVVYGVGPNTGQLLATIANDQNNDVRICGYFDEHDPATDRNGRDIKGLERWHCLGALQDLVDFARQTRVDIVILDLPLTAEERVVKALHQLTQLPVDIRMPANASRLRFQPRTYSYIGQIPFIDLSDRPIPDWGQASKWAFDKAVAGVALVLLAPVMLGIAATIKLTSKGPVLFRQKRYGFNNELIEVFKFRSMYTELTDADATKLVTKGDPRVTPIGRFIRKTSIDELPQLLNVLRGDLSLVGPRPHALQAKAGDALYDEVVDEYFARHKVKPGITGWAQINGWRGETDTFEKIRKRVEHDLYYIENWSIFFDLYILARTPFALIETDNAY
ncbi:MAG: undecaprenyl-phosphate glucose phosphotransferase [Pseudomonadota bacterium]